MIAVASFLLVLLLSLLVIRIGAVALVMTGLSRDIAQFQALSAFSGAGFTTDEAESLLEDPARRQIIAVLIRLGSVGVATSIATLLLSFIETGGATLERLLVLFVGVGGLYLLARSPFFDQVITPVIEWGLNRYTELELRDYANLLNLYSDYQVVEIEVKDDTWLSEQSLEELHLTDEGVLVLGIDRPGEEYIGAPPSELRLLPGDCLVAYGGERHLQELATREAGDVEAHREAVNRHEQVRVEQEERLEDAESA